MNRTAWRRACFELPACLMLLALAACSTPQQRRHVTPPNAEPALQSLLAAINRADGDAFLGRMSPNFFHREDYASSPARYRNVAQAERRRRFVERCRTELDKIRPVLGWEFVRLEFDVLDVNWVDAEGNRYPMRLIDSGDGGWRVIDFLNLAYAIQNSTE